MSTFAGYNSDDIREAVKQKKKRKPEYALMFDLYEKIYIAQEESKSSIQLNDFTITDEVLSAKIKGEFPLLNISQFLIDQNASEKLFKNLCTILLEAGSELSESVKTISDLIAMGKLNLNNLFSEFLKENEDYFLAAVSAAINGNLKESTARSAKTPTMKLSSILTLKGRKNIE